jgi:hypothetical protein
VRALLAVFIVSALAPAAHADPLPDAGPLALDAFFDGCMGPVSARKDPAPALERAIASVRHDPAASPDAAHPEHKLWRVRGVDGDVEIETATGRAWCEVRLIGADPDAMARRLNNALSRLDVPTQRRSASGGAPGETVEQVIVGHDADDAFVVIVRKSREPKDGEPGLVLSASPLRAPAGGGQ